MNIDDKKYTWGYIIVLAIIIVLCLIGGLFGEAHAASSHTFGYEWEYNNARKVNCWNGMSSVCEYKYKYYYDELGRHITQKYVICGQCNQEIYMGYGNVGTHVFSEWKTYGMGIEGYDQARDCYCGYRETKHIKHEESDWSAWKYICYAENTHQDYYERYITIDGYTATDYKYVEHKHVATAESASRSYHWINFGGDCQYSVTRECERCGCNYEDINTTKKHEYKFNRYADGHDVWKCVSCNYEIDRDHEHTWTESDVEESDRQYLHSSNMCYLEKHYEKCVCGAKHQIGAVEYKHEMQCVGHVDSTATKCGYNEYGCANCDYTYRVKLPLISEYMYEKYYDEETGISYFESNVTSEYYYRALTEDGYIYAASFEELFVTIFGEEYDPLYFEEYYPHALTIETGIYVCPEV